MSCSRSPENTSCPAADWRPLLVSTLQPVLSLAISPSDVLAASVLTLTSHARLFCCCVNGLPIITTPPPTLVQEESTQKALRMGESRIYTRGHLQTPWGSLVARHDSTLLIGQLSERGRMGGRAHTGQAGIQCWLTISFKNLPANHLFPLPGMLD